MQAVTISIEDVFKILIKLFQVIVPLYALFSSQKKLINRKRAFKRHNDAPKRGIEGYNLKMFSTFFPITNL